MARPGKRNKIKKISPALENPISANREVQTTVPSGSNPFIGFFGSWLSTIFFVCAFFLLLKIASI